MLKNAVDSELRPRSQGGEGRSRARPAGGAASLQQRNGGLTMRELQILQFIVDGKSNKEIADQLNLSVNTVAVHRANIMDALGIHKTAELVVYAIRNGLVNIP
jgi:DNA-binding NarL/FixJ family response regulator